MIRAVVFLFVIVSTAASARCAPTQSRANAPVLPQPTGSFEVGRVDFHWLGGGDHGFRVPKSLGGTGEAAVLAEVADVSARWVADLPA